MERRLAAILAADVVGYTSMMARDETGTLDRLTRLRETRIEPLIKDHRGRIVKLMGDGFLVEFASSVDAVSCAVAWQDTAQQAQDEEGDEIRFRIGLNIGDVIIDGDDIHGDGVNVASRLEGIAEPGGICLSDDAYRQVRGKIDVDFVDLGDRELKNVPEPVRIYRVARGEATEDLATEEMPPPIPEKPSIVVLPFNNMSGDPEQDYFSDGITEDIITDLSKVSGLFVIARNSAFTYKNKPIDVAEICRRFGVRFALEGSIRKAGNRVRINAQLINGSDGGHEWAERFDRDLTDIFQVQDDVTRNIVEALKVNLTEEENSQIAGAGTTNIEAHDLFLRGRELGFGRERNREMFQKASDYYRQAIELDSDFAAPLAGLGMLYVLDYQNRWSDTPETSLDRAIELADEAIGKDHHDAFSHYVAGIAAMWKCDYDRWEREIETALQLNPNHALSVSARGVLLTYTGKPREAIPVFEKAMRLDPAFQHQFIHFLGTAEFLAGDYEAAADYFRKRIALTPDTDLSRSFLASTLGHLNRPDEAQAVWNELKEINPDYSYSGHFGRLPFQNPADRDRLVEGLRKAGIIG